MFVKFDDMWGMHAIGIDVRLYNRRPKQAFAEVRQAENRKPDLSVEAIRTQKLPTESVFETETIASKIWRMALLAFALFGLSLFALAIYALVG